MKKNKKLLAIYLIIIAISLLSFHLIQASIAKINSHNKLIAHTNDTIRIQIGFVGDIMAHLAQLDAQKTDSGTYDFNDNYRLMQLFFQSNDLMIGNLETTFTGKERGYSAYPLFNTPDPLAEALKNAGFDLLSTANNHMYDQGTDGLMRTMEVLSKNKLLFTGSRKNVRDKNYIVYNVNGIRVGVIAYTYETTPDSSEFITINGLKIKKEDQALINSFDPSKPAETVAKWRSDVTRMKKDSADFLITIIHWGNEYQLKPCSYQVALADSLNKLGIDIIFGSHPHVVQPIDIIVDSVRNHTTFVSYSSGNFISNQRFETLQNYNTEDGLYLEVKIMKIKNQKAQIQHIKTIPTWVNRYPRNGKFGYEVTPLPLILNNPNEKNNYTEEQWNRMTESFNRTNERIKMVDSRWSIVNSR
ncbi:MAG: CapA domain protein [Bacteroidetes bacterium]|nr:CapA domain protein [Bacteroidota bacterium]